VLAITAVVLVVELVGAYLASSLALLADAGHNLSDVLSLLLAWGAVVLARRAPTERRTYGLRKATILASLTNAILLMLAVGAIVSESIRRFAEPASVSTNVVMLTAGLGIVINTATALMFMRGGKGDLIMRGVEVGAAALVLVFGLALLAGYMASERMGI
jgi:cobalt-zinc-cadmium efflux system protein